MTNWMILPFFFFYSTLTSAAPVPSLSAYFHEQFERAPELLAACSSTEGTAPESWEMTTLFLDVSPYVGIGIPGIFQIQVAPEVEFVFAQGDGS